ncbi:MAG TPA: hypothetical protein VMW03_08450 [Candidatus Krumholzibacteriaceae bacterium]|nr:hypothetical protein [Candidatus Krumholzibacteriaceae bacterium]
MSLSCPVHEGNLDNCACTNMECERRGMCCACVANHRSHGNLPVCLRPPAN